MPSRFSAIMLQSLLILFCSLTLFPQGMCVYCALNSWAVLFQSNDPNSSRPFEHDECPCSRCTPDDAGDRLVQEHLRVPPMLLGSHLLTPPLSAVPRTEPYESHDGYHGPPLYLLQLSIQI